MALPEPKPGLVFRYDYLWGAESLAGRGHGKDRPACLVAATDPGTQPRFVVILPIAHSPPFGATVGVEIPSAVRHLLGLDEEPCWVIVSEYNVDEWPNAGIMPIPGRPRAFSYGFLPPGLYRKIKTEFLELAERGRSQRTRR